MHPFIVCIYKKGTLKIKDLEKILSVLKDGNFQTTKWFDLGLKLKLSHNDLTTINKNHPADINRCLQECVALWLRSDTAATWDTLANAVSATGDKAAAAHISKINNYNIHSIMISVESVNNEN